EVRGLRAMVATTARHRGAETVEQGGQVAVGASEPTEVERVSPPFGRDRLAHLWIATRTMSAVTDAIWSIGLAWTAVQVGSPASAGVVVAAGTVPRAAFLLVGGEFADRFDVRRVMIWANIGRLVALAGVVVADLSAGPAYVTLVVGAVLLGAADAIYDPAAASVARQIVHPSEIPKYTGVYQPVGRLGSLLGSALGGVVVAHWAVQGTAAFNIVAFGAVLIFVIFGLKIRYPLEKSSHNSVLEGLVGTFDHLRSQPVTRALVLSQMFINVFIAPCLGLGIVVRVDELGFGAEYVGYVGVVVGIGAVLGALWTVRFNVGRPGLIGYVLFAV